MQGSQTLYEQVARGDRREHGVSNMAIYSSIALFLLVFWLTVAFLIL